MAYQIKFTETTNPAKPSITVEDQRLNQETSLQFPGKNYAGYAPVIAENFLHLLENFAKTTAPNNPVQGQLWFDNSAGVNLLKVFDGTNWTAAGSVKKAASAPLVASSIKGDLWVDTDNQQLYVYSGSNWLLIGPQFSAGLKTGPDIETIVDTNNVSHNVITMYSENYRIAIISKAAFTPKATIVGFTEINQGINLSNVDVSNPAAPTKFWGTASQSDALNIPGEAKPVAASNFLRSDQTSTTNFPFNIRSSSGLSVGNDLSFNIATDINTSATVLQSKTSGGSVSIRLNNNGTPNTVLYVDANSRVGIGSNNTNPQATLDVNGTVRVASSLYVEGQTETTGPGTGSIVTAGGLSVRLKSNFSSDATFYGPLRLNNLDNNDTPTGGAVIIPSANNLYDIGTDALRFRNIYANSFVGNFSGTFTGPVTGYVTGSAAKLASPTTFSIVGDVASTNFISFDGQGDDPAIFNTVITQDLITSKEKITDSEYTDELLIYRPDKPGISGGLKRTTKESFIANIPTIPVGAIFPYAGLTPPNGYLLCDGSEVRLSDYPALYSVINYTYKAANLLIGRSTFALPDLRGRFPLGPDNMDNGLEVPDKDNENILRDAGGSSANRVSSVTADVVGASSGTEQRTIVLENLPEHRHSLNSGTQQYFASGIPAGSADSNAVANFGMPNSSTGYGLPNSGGVLSERLGTPILTMNPYQTINYIIFTGKIQ